ncbi:MAG TPA: HEAT repeat domain-containing protein [Oligoflexia bacterium]|nr:HEAT repeat domain-containing protein [Oligoflexia bacterium]
MNKIIFVTLAMVATLFSLADSARAKNKSRRVFGILERSVVLDFPLPYGYVPKLTLSFESKNDFDPMWSKSLTADNWNDFWFDWASKRLLFPTASNKLEIETKVETLSVLGTLRIPKTFDFILTALKDRLEFIEVRKAAIQSLKDWGGFVSARILADQLKLEKDPEIKLALHDALNQIGGRPNERNLSVTSSPDGSSRLEWQ